MGHLTDEQFKFDVVDGQLVLTVRFDAVRMCDECPDVHVLLFPVATVQNLGTLAAGLKHLAGHVRDRKQR